MSSTNDCLKEISRHKLFQLISSGNRPPQNFSAHFLRKSSAHKTFSAHFLRKSAATNFFGSFPQEIAGMVFHSFPQEIDGWSSTHFLRKSAGCGSPPYQTHDTLRGAYFDWTGRGERRRISSAGEVKSRWKRMPTPWRVSDLKL